MFFVFQSRDYPNEPDDKRKDRALENLSLIEQLLEEEGLACTDPIIKVSVEIVNIFSLVK